MKIKRALTLSNLHDQKIERIPFEGEFFETYDQPQAKGTWFIWGNSGSGKSSYTMQLTKAFAEHYKCFYNPLEEGTDNLNFVNRTLLFDMHEVSKNFNTQKYNFKDLMIYLGQRNSARVIVLDSARYVFKNISQYEEMTETFPNKLYLITGHAEGKEPKTSMEKDIMYDAEQKIFCDAYSAQCKGRSIGENGGEYIIWKEGYEKARGVQQLKTS